ncbi:RDD family protein [bacterium]|nr:RDD family protein [bacterium]
MTAVEKASLTPAPLGPRIWAFLIDSLVLCLFGLMTQFILPYAMPLLVWFFYKTLSEASAAQATPGKRAMGLIVVNARGGRVSLGVSLLRSTLAWFSVFSFFLVYFVAFFTPKRQALHDLVADTLVVEGSKGSDFPSAWTDEVKKLGKKIRDAFDRLK